MLQLDHALHARQRDLRLTSDADHLCAQQVQTVSQRAAQVAHADDDHRRPADHAHASGPLPYVPLLLHILRKMLIHRDQLPDDIFADHVAETAGRVAQADLLLVQLFHIVLLISSALQLQQLQMRIIGKRIRIRVADDHLCIMPLCQYKMLIDPPERLFVQS